MAIPYSRFPFSDRDKYNQINITCKSVTLIEDIEDDQNFVRQNT